MRLCEVPGDQAHVRGMSKSSSEGAAAVVWSLGINEGNRRRSFNTTEKTFAEFNMRATVLYQMYGDGDVCG